MLELMLDMSSDVFCWLSSDLYYFLGEKELELEKKKKRCINIMLWNNDQYGGLLSESFVKEIEWIQWERCWQHCTINDL